MKFGLKITKHFFYMVCILLLNLFAPVASSQTQGSYKVLNEATREKLSLMIRKDTSITVESFDKSIDSVLIQINTALDIGPNYTTWRWLVSAIDNGMSEKEMRRNPSRLVGSVFTLKKNLYLLSDEEITKRKTKKSAAKSR